MCSIGFQPVPRTVRHEHWESRAFALTLAIDFRNPGVWQKALDSAYYKLTLRLAGIPSNASAIGFCSAVNTNNPS
jgi:hypothetical protein